MISPEQFSELLLKLEDIKDIQVWQFALITAIFCLCIMILISQYISKIKG